MAFDNPLILPSELNKVRESALKFLGELEPAGSPKSEAEPKGLMLSSRTAGGRDLPPYYLVYFLLIDLLEFPHMGQWEKSAWTVPVRYKGRLYGIEHRKMGLGVFAPNLNPKENRSGTPTKAQETDANEITALIAKAVAAAEPYFEWRAEQAALGSDLNVLNLSATLYVRYRFFREQFKTLSEEATNNVKKRDISNEVLDDVLGLTTGYFPSYTPNIEAEWNAQAAIEAFFSWTEHVFIHLAILQGSIRTGEDVAKLAESNWKVKFKAAMKLENSDTKAHYDKLLDLRAQIRNFMAHGSFGKQGEALQFHSGAGAAPVLLTNNQHARYSLSGKPSFDESTAIDEIEAFIDHLWSGPRAPAKEYILSHLPSILSFAVDGSYDSAMSSVDSMKQFIEKLSNAFDNAGNMDW